MTFDDVDPNELAEDGLRPVLCEKQNAGNKQKLEQDFYCGMRRPSLTQIKKQMRSVEDMLSMRVMPDAARVAIAPAEIAFTRIRFGPSSWAR